MAIKKSKNSLGKGLDALFNDGTNDLSLQNLSISVDSDSKPKAFNTLPIEKIYPSSLQPRKYFNDTKITELASSIKERGLLQPILVREGDAGNYEIIAGERRWRASQIAKIHEIPVVVKNLSDTEVLEVALIENLQRSDLTPIEEAEGFKKLIDQFGHSQNDIANLVSKSRSHIANLLRLLNLPSQIKKYLEDGKISMGHARALLGAKNSLSIAKIIIAKGLSVRAVEQMIAKSNSIGNTIHIEKNKKDVNTIAIEKQLQDTLGLKVNIQFDGKGGSLTFYYSDLEQLDELVTKVLKKSFNK